MTAAGLVLVAVFTSVGCEEAARSPSPSALQCGLPTPEENADPSLLPEAFVVEGAEVVKVQTGKDRITAALNMQKSVTEVYEIYSKVARGSDFDVVGTDNEGFEAEIYMRKGPELGAIQIRTSTCDDASVVFINIVRT